MYEPNKFLIKAVESGNAYTVRGAIAGIIHANPRNQNEEVENAIEYAEKHGIAVFETDDDPSFEIVLDETQWNGEYFASSMTALHNNFTHERLAHVLAVSKKTHPVTVIDSASKQKQSFDSNAGVETQKMTLEGQASSSTQKKAMSHWKTALIAVAGVALVALVIVLLVNNGSQK